MRIGIAELVGDGVEEMVASSGFEFASEFC